MKKNVIENKIDKGVNIDFNFKDIDEKIDYSAKKGRISFKWLAPAFTCCLVALLGVAYFGMTNSSKASAIDMDTQISELCELRVLEMEFNHEKVHYGCSFSTPYTYLDADEIANENKVDNSIVGEKVFTKEINNSEYDIYTCLEDNSLLIKYLENVYLKAPITGFDNDVTTKYMLEKAFSLKESDYTSTSQSFINSINEFSSEDVDNFFFGLLDSSIDNQGYEKLMSDIYQESVNKGVVTGNGYRGSVKETHTLNIKIGNEELNVIYYETYYIHSPKYIRMYNNYIKLDSKASDVLLKYYPDIED